MRGDEKRFGILDLVRATGIARRTIRYYVQRELLAPPEGAGRGHYYTEDHRDRLLRIRDLQDRGMTLGEIRETLERGALAAGVVADQPEIDVVTRIKVSGGIELLVGHGDRPPTPAQIRALAAAAARILSRGGRKESS